MGLQDCVYTDGIKDLLVECLDKNSLYALASTATNNKIIADNEQEAMELILRYTESVLKFFSYRRITSQVLFNYLHKKKVDVKVTDTKDQLKDTLKKYWEEQFAMKNDKGTALVARARETEDESSFQLLRSSESQHTHVHCSSSSSSNSSSGDLDIHLFSHKFCEWFYSMINGLQNNGHGMGGDVLSPDAFMANSYMEICLQGAQKTQNHSTSGPQETYDVFKNVCETFRLTFVPNSEFGVGGEVSEHGLIKVWCNGTLQVNNAMVGIFEQVFGVVKSAGGKWKIMKMKVDLKSQLI